jgi:YVTN family beta-propeller protein
MEIRLLGVTEARIGGRPIALGAAQQRAVLAMLALRPNAPVSIDSLIEGLWGERAPPTAHKIVQLHVSRLRRLLDGQDAEIVTRGRGYELRLPDDAVDASRFERLVAQAERGDGNAGAAAEQALALWRGPPLDDLADIPFAAPEIRRLDELWLSAREVAIERALTAGRHREVIGELDDLVASHPLRERLHAQRMLALYRCDRQADALSAYREAREVLTEQAGIEPGPELRRLQEAILHQDPALDTRTSARPRPRSRPSRALVLLGAAILGGAIAGAVALARQDGPPEAVNVPPDSVAVIDVRSNAVVAAVGVDDAPGPIAAGAGFLWVLNLNSETVSRIDVRAGRVLRTQGIADEVGNLAASPDEVWLATRCQSGGQPGALVHLFSGRAGGVDVYGGDEIELEGVTPRRGATDPMVTTVCALAAEGRSAWIASHQPPGLVRADYDPVAEGSEVVWARALERAPTALAVGSGLVWATDSGNDVIRAIDANTGRDAGVHRTGTDPVAVAADDDAVWIANEGDDSVSRFELGTNTIDKPIPVGDAPAAVAVGAGAVWVANAGDGTVTRIDQRTHRPSATIAIGHRPQGIAVAGGSVWVTVRG